MSNVNVDRLRKAYEAFNSGVGYDADLLAPDFELRQASSIIDTAGVFHGSKAIRDVMAELDESFEQLRVEAEKFTEAPDDELVVFVRMRGRGRGSGLEVDNLIAHVWTFREQKAARLVVYEEPAEALRAMGLAE